jgi:hypothetical protein
MVDAFTEFFDEHPPTHINGLNQIDLISVSQKLALYINRAFILSLMDSKGNHSTICIDFDLGALTLHGDLCEIDPGHAENQNLVSTDVKATTAFLKIIKMKNSAHNVTTQMHKLFERCNQTGLCTKMTDDCTGILVMCCAPMQNKLRKNPRRLEPMPGHEC